MARLEKRMEARLSRRRRDVGHLQPPARQRSRLELRREQLAHGREPTCVRHPRVEPRLDPHAGAHAFDLSPHLLPREPGRLGHDGGRRAGAPARFGDADAYVVGAEEDHIAPWRSSYAGATRLGGPVRFVLTSSGHIAGIVNPPSPKRSFRLNDALPAGADEWLAGSESRQGSWWEDWTEWIGERAGERRKPPRLGSRKNPPLAGPRHLRARGLASPWHRPRAGVRVGPRDARQSIDKVLLLGTIVIVHAEGEP